MRPSRHLCAGKLALWSPSSRIIGPLNTGAERVCGWMVAVPSWTCLPDPSGGLPPLWPVSTKSIYRHLLGIGTCPVLAAQPLPHPDQLKEHLCQREEDSRGWVTTSGRTPERTGAHLQNACQGSSPCQGCLEPPLIRRCQELCYQGHPGLLLCSTHPPLQGPALCSGAVIWEKSVHYKFALSPRCQGKGGFF